MAGENPGNLGDAKQHVRSAIWNRVRLIHRGVLAGARFSSEHDRLNTIMHWNLGVDWVLKCALSYLPSQRMGGVNCHMRHN